MLNRSYAGLLLAVGVVGLAVTCFVATSAIRPASAAPEPAVMPQQAVNTVSQPTPQPESVQTAIAEADPAPASVALAIPRDIADAGRVAACQAEFDLVAKENPVAFPRDRWDLDASAKAAVSKLAIVGKACAALKIEIQAFTDNQGKRAANTRLSSKRAEAVKEYLVELGLSPGLLTAVGFGPDRPVASNRTASGRARNRRIEFRVTRVESE